ncbi:MAG: hypothetical protein ACFC1C_00980 [Candidatus Malihini olakiniferum]
MNNISARSVSKDNPVSGSTYDNTKPRTALIDYIAPDLHISIEVKGSKDVVSQPQD